MPSTPAPAALQDVADAPALPGRENELLDGLERIFLQEGFRRVPVGDLATRLHCSRRSLYELASGKNALFLRVLQRLLDRIRDCGLEAAQAAPDVHKRIIAILEPGVSELRGAGNLFFADIKSFAPAERMLRTHQLARSEDMQQVIEEGIRLRAFRGVNPELVTDIMLAAIQRIMEGDMRGGTPYAISHAMEALEDLLLHGLLHPEAERSAAP